MHDAMAKGITLSNNIGLELPSLTKRIVITAKDTNENAVGTNLNVLYVSPTCGNNAIKNNEVINTIEEYMNIFLNIFL